jgi:hypothetical protein
MMSTFLDDRMGQALREIEARLNGVTTTGRPHGTESQRDHLAAWNGPEGVRQQAMDHGFFTEHENEVLARALDLWAYVSTEESRHRINAIISALHSARHHGGPTGFATFSRADFEAKTELLRKPKEKKPSNEWRRSRRERERSGSLVPA